MSDFWLVSTGTYYLVPAPIFVQKALDLICLACDRRTHSQLSLAHC